MTWTRLRHGTRLGGREVPFEVASMVGDPDLVTVCSVEHVDGRLSNTSERALFACAEHPRAGLKCRSCLDRHVLLRHEEQATEASRAWLFHVPVAGRDDKARGLVSSAALIVVGFS